MRTNFLEAKTQLAPFADGGKCPDDPAVGAAINEACARLIDSGKWKDTIRQVAFCHRAGVITMPRNVETILEFADCGVPITVHNQWYEFLPGGPWKMSECNSWPAMAELGDNFCTAFDITGEMKVRIYNDLSVDDGGHILLQGVNSDGNRVQTLSDGEWVDGEVLVFNNATPPTTTVTWTKLEAIQKEYTTGPIRIYQVDPDTNLNAGLLVILDPNDTIPAFRRYYYGGFCPTRCDDTDTPVERYHPLTFLVKTRFNNLVRDTDIVPITAAGALKNMVMALFYEKTNNRDLADKYEGKALQCLQNELKQFQGSQVSMKVKIAGFGNYAPVRSFY